MKSSLAKLAVMFLFMGLIFFCCMEGWGADWKQYFKTENSEYYFDAETLTSPSTFIIRTTVKFILTDKGVKSSVQRLGKAFENIDYSIQSLEINCAVKTANILEVIIYSKTGDIITREDYSSSSDWRPIPPKTPYEALMKAVCQQSKEHR